jgi:hypothetical protein
MQYGGGIHVITATLQYIGHCVLQTVKREGARGGENLKGKSHEK